MSEDRLKILASAAKSARENWEDARESRDAEIAHEDEAGTPLREIARRTGLSPSHVQRIVISRAAAGQG